MDVLEVGMLVGVGNDRDPKGGFLRVAYGKAYSIDSDRSLLDRDVPFVCEFRICLVFESIEPATICFFDRGTDSGHIYVSLDNVPIKSATEKHTSLEINKVTDCELAEVRAIQSLLNGCDCIGLFIVCYDSEAYSIVSNTLIDLEFARKGTGKG